MVWTWVIWIVNNIPLISQSIKWVHNKLIKNERRQKLATFLLVTFFVISIGVVYLYINSELDRRELLGANTDLRRDLTNTKTELEKYDSSVNPLNLKDHYFDEIEDVGDHKINHNYSFVYKFVPEYDLDLTATAWIVPELEDKKSRPEAYVEDNAPSKFEHNKLGEIQIKVITHSDPGTYKLCVKLIDRSKLRKGDIDKEFIECDNLPINE